MYLLLKCIYKLVLIQAPGLYNIYRVSHYLRNISIFYQKRTDRKKKRKSLSTDSLELEKKF